MAGDLAEPAHRTGVGGLRRGALIAAGGVDADMTRGEDKNGEERNGARCIPRDGAPLRDLPARHPRGCGRVCPQRRAGNARYTPPGEPYPMLLADTGYTDIRYEEIPITRDWDIDHILGYLYSTSFSARHLYADRVTQFETTLRARLLESTGGVDRFTEHTTFGIHTGVHDRCRNPESA
jgi:hypothetical protein